MKQDDKSKKKQLTHCQMGRYNNNKFNPYLNAQNSINPCFNNTLLQSVIRYEKVKVIKEEWDIVAKQLRILCEGLRDAVKESNDILQNGTPNGITLPKNSRIAMKRCFV